MISAIPRLRVESSTGEVHAPTAEKFAVVSDSVPGCVACDGRSRDGPDCGRHSKRDRPRHQAEDLAAAQKALLDAQVGLTASQKAQVLQVSVTDQVAAAKAASELSAAQKAAAEAEKATADAQKAKSEAGAAAIKAAIGEVPAGGLAGGVTLGVGVGDIEATLLATKAVKIAAKAIASRIHQSAPEGRILALAVSDVPAFRITLRTRLTRAS